MVSTTNGFCIWLSGLPGSGKSTISKILKTYIESKNIKVAALDGDILRKEFNYDLGFTKEDRRKNVHRAAYIAKLIVNVGGIVIVSLVSPYKNDRSDAYDLIGKDKVLPFILSGNPGNKEHWVDTIYEFDIGEEILIDTDKKSIEESLKIITKEIHNKLDMTWKEFL